MDKRVAPTLVVILLVFFMLVQTGGLIYVIRTEGLGFLWSAILIGTPLIIIVALITVYIERIREIDDEEKDDLSKY
jgi:hypothetical protein